MLLIILIKNFCIGEYDAVDVFCKKINEIRDEIKEKMKENKRNTND